MYTLVIENSTQHAALALFKGEEAVFSKQVGLSVRDSSKIIFCLKEALEQLGVTLGGISKIIVGDEPGSYTGVRIASVIGQTLSYVLKVPLSKVPSIKGLIPKKQGKFLSVLDARSAGVYAIQGEKKGDLVHFLGQPKKYALQEFKQLLSDVDGVVSTDMKSITDNKGISLSDWGVFGEESEICLRALVTESDCNHYKNVV